MYQLPSVHEINEPDAMTKEQRIEEKRRQRERVRASLIMGPDTMRDVYPNRKETAKTT